MKVLYLITNRSHGLGGHFYSIKSTVEELAKCMDVCVLNIGVSVSPVLSGASLNVLFIEYSGFLSTFKECYKSVKLLNPDVIHAFDLESAFWGRLLSIRFKVPFLFTKCGGPNPKRYYPLINHIVLYSRENLEYFLHKKKYKNSHLYLIPNRVQKLSCDFERIRKLRLHIRSEAIVLLRIARISSFYKRSIRQSISLANKLSIDGFNVQLMIIGTVQDVAVYNDLKESENDNVRIITDHEYANNAAELIDIADMVIGTGRSFMEAATLGKIMLVPNDNTDIPVLVNQKNIDKFLFLNFSERISIEQEDKNESYREIKNILTNMSENKKLSYFISDYAQKNFSVEGIFDKYKVIYSKASSVKVTVRTLIDLCLHLYLTKKVLNKAKKLWMKK